jgi:hypothetical protein
MLKHKEANPLTVFGLRRMTHCPPHFTPIKFDLRTNEKIISDWIWEHLEGRFYMGDEYQENGKNLGMRKVVAFEVPGEASYFSLLLDTINRNLDLDW